MADGTQDVQTVSEAEPVNAQKPAAGEPDWTDVLGLPCRVRFGFPISDFTIGELLGLEVGSVIDSGRREGTHVEVELNDRIIGSAEMEPSDGKLAFRLTELD